jgi:hypothetical protein
VSERASERDCARERVRERECERERERGKTLGLGRSGHFGVEGGLLLEVEAGGVQKDLTPAREELRRLLLHIRHHNVRIQSAYATIVVSLAARENESCGAPGCTTAGRG